MIQRYPFIRWLPVIVNLGLFLIAAAVYFLRPPVVVVGDMLFSQLYNPGRERNARFISSMSLGRRIVIAEVEDGAETETVAIAAKNAAKHPYLVLFPFRYAGAQRHYSKFLETEPGYKKAKSYVLGERNARPSDIEEADFAATDTLTDAWNAGLIAGVIAVRVLAEAEAAVAAEAAASNRQVSRLMPTSVVFYHDGWLSGADRARFQEGLRAAGWTNEPVYRITASNFMQDDMACAVVSGPAESFLSTPARCPMILYSWFDPAFFPRQTAANFDDSPWGVVENLVRQYSKRNKKEPPVPIVTPSKITYYEKGLASLVSKVKPFTTTEAAVQ